MRLTDYTDYSLRALMYIGMHPERLVTIQEIADAYAISKSHLMKVVHQLGIAGFVETVRGRSGGLRLGMRPEDILIGEVVRTMEPDFAMVECFKQEGNNCLLSPSCELQGALANATRSYVATLNEYTLAQVLRNSRSLRRISTVQMPARSKARVGQGVGQK